MSEWAESDPIGFDPVAAGLVTLRPWEPADVSFVYDACQDTEIQRWTNLPSPFRASDAVALLQFSTTLRDRGTAALFAITSTDQGELLGAISLRDIERDGGRDSSRASVGYWVSVEARGRGFASAAVGAAAAWAFDALGVAEVYADVLHGNDASVRVLERCGFAPDGDSSCAQRGVTQPSIRYTLRAPPSD
jgi:RimJ/RimL family protein N-acetyltransferase